MIIARRLLADRRRSMLWWSVGTLVMVVLSIALWPSVRESEELDEVVQDLPEGVRALIGAQEGIALTSPEGYLSGRLWTSLLPILLIVFGIGLGARAIGGAEEEGTIELLLAQPVRRVRVAVERAGAMVVLLVGLALVAMVAVLVLGPSVGLLDGIAVGHVVGATVALIALALLHAAIAFAVGCATGRRGTAQAVAGGVAVAGYVLQGLASAADAARPARIVTPWHWYLDRNLFVDWPTAAATLLPLALAAVLVAVGVRAFAARDLRLP